MILPRREDALHKTYLYRLLMGIIDNQRLSRRLRFKGGTCATLAGWLDRFSLDLDFDLTPTGDLAVTRHVFEAVVGTLGLVVKQRSGDGALWVLQYPSRPGERNSIKVSIMSQVVKANGYTPLYLSDINRYVVCQTKDTMVANKLVAPVDRYERNGTIAGRDIYDIHFFLSHGYAYNEAVIGERRHIAARDYLDELYQFIRNRVTDRVIAEDLNYLLPPAKFQTMRNTLKDETLMLIGDLGKRASVHFPS